MPDQPLEQRIEKWLATQGYPLEMEVAQEFRANGFRVAQGAYYEDPDTNQPREIDVVVSQARMLDELQVFVTCYVECKRTVNKPWVLFSTQRSPQESPIDHYSMITSSLGTQLLFSLVREEHLPLPRLLKPRERLGYGVTQVTFNKKSGVHEGHDGETGAEKSERDRPDVAYRAVMSAVKASVRREIFIKSSYEGDKVWPEPVVELVVPLVVIDAPLFEYFLNESEEKVLRRIHSGVLGFGNPIPGRNQSTLVHIVTKEGLPEFASSLAGVVEHWNEGAGQYRVRLTQGWQRFIQNRAERMERERAHVASILG